MKSAGISASFESPRPRSRCGSLPASESRSPGNPFACRQAPTAAKGYLFSFFGLSAVNYSLFPVNCFSQSYLHPRHPGPSRAGLEVAAAGQRAVAVGVDADVGVVVPIQQVMGGEVGGQLVAAGEPPAVADPAVGQPKGGKTGVAAPERSALALNKT